MTRSNSHQGTKRRILIAFIAGACLFAPMASACISSPHQGMLLTYGSHHSYGAARGTQIGKGRVLKRGESCSWGTLWPLSVVMVSGTGGYLREAMQRAGITKIAVVDRDSTSILGPVFYRECVVVWGE